MTDRPTAALYDTDGTFIADLPLAAGIQWQDELSAPGAVSLRLPLDDSATLQATARRIFKVSWRGAVRQAARIDASSTEVAVDGRVWREWSNLPGLLSVLGGVPVYPEYGLNRASNGQRTFGYMARQGSGEWLASGNWTDAIGVSWASMTGVRAGKPEGLDYPNPQWIAKRGPDNVEPPLSYQYFRRRFTTSTAMTVQILCTADNFLDLWLDGEHLVDASGQGEFAWREAQQLNVLLPVGWHVLAARVRNQTDPTSGYNPMALLVTVQQTATNGDVIATTPLINSNTNWSVSDVTPGWLRAEALAQLWAEAASYQYAATDLLALGFTVAVDSDGEAWTETPGEYTVDVGSSLLDVVSAFTEKDVDMGVDPGSLHLQMWNRRGSDLTDTVQLLRGVDGGNLISHRVERTEPTYNTVLMQLADGRWMQRQDVASVTAIGREGGGIAAGSTNSTATANAIADAQLLEASHGTVTFATQVSSLVGPQVYADFGLGDTITVPDEDGTGAYAARVMAVTVDASNDGPVQVTPELMVDRSATPLITSDGGAGTGDGGDITAPDGGTGGTTSGGDSGGPTSGGGTDVAYDWTAIPYGSAYDAAGGAGGYVPDDTHAGVPAGTTFAQTQTASGGYLTINSASRTVGTGTAAASTNLITVAGHGLANGHPIWLTGLTGGAGLSAGVAAWGVVADAATDTFQIARANEDTGVFSTVDVTADYSAVTVMAGVWYDLVDFACHITIASAASGLLLFTRCRHRGPAAALSPTGPNPAQGLIFNLSNALVLGADQDFIPDAPVPKLDALYGKGFRLWRSKWKHTIDGLGSHGNNVLYGPYGTAAAWFYPDPEHTDGSHCDTGMQVFGGDKHRIIGGHIEGLVDASVSSTSNPTGRPIPGNSGTYPVTNSVLQVNHASSLAPPTNVLWDKCLLGGGGYTINIAGLETLYNVGRINGRFKRNARWGAIAAPSPGAHSGVTIHYDTSGCVHDDDGTTVVPYSVPGTWLVWP